MISKSAELDLLLQVILESSGYDFRNYARPSLQRRFDVLLAQSNLKHLSEMIPLVLYDEQFLDQVLRSLSITVTEMFRDPSFYRAFRRDVVPVLKDRPTLKVWHAGCATGEEVYSMAILLKEEGLYDRARIYATDFNRSALHTAQEGIYSLDAIKKGTENYIEAGGQGSFSMFYHALYDSAKIHDYIKKNITFSHHNLATDIPFGEMDLILCRNVLIYFDRTLQQRVFSLFTDSLHPDGFLCLGMWESLDLSDLRERFENIARGEKIYRHDSKFVEDNKKDKSNSSESLAENPPSVRGCERFDPGLILDPETSNGVFA